MMQERALALRSQEERLGAMISALQMEKAREVSSLCVYVNFAILSSNINPFYM